MNIEESYTAPANIPVWLNWLPTILLIVIMVVFWFMFMQQAQGGGGKGVMNFGKSKAKMSSPDE